MTNRKEILQHYTYIYLNPLKKGSYAYDNGKISFEYEPFYIGKGSLERYKKHLIENKRDNNRHKKNTIKKIQKNGLEPIIIKVLENVNEQTAFDKEIELIWVIGRADLKMGSLTNMSWGGEGNDGRTRIDIIGQEYGRLTVIEYSGKDKNKNSLWVCKCDCGNEKTIRGSHLKNGGIRSCGCLNKEVAKKRMMKHGLTGTPLYQLWQKLLFEKNEVCERWVLSFENFCSDIEDKPSDEYLFGRIDYTKPYAPDNYKWMTMEQRHNNRSNTRYLTIDTECKTIKEWAEISGTPYNTIRRRIYGLEWEDREAVYGKKNY